MAGMRVPFRVIASLAALFGACSVPFHADLFDAADQAKASATTTESCTLTPGTLVNGSMTPASATAVKAGAVTRIVATPSSGYAFTGWSASPSANASFANATSASTTVTLSGNATITPAFSLATVSYTLTPGTLANGSMTPASATTVAAGAAMQIVATPSSGYAFTGWSASPSANASFANATSASTTVTLSGNVTITPAFSAVYSIIYSANGLAGYTPPTDAGTYSSGQTVTAMAPGTAPAGSAFAGWSTIANGSGPCYSGSGSGSDSTDTFAMGTGTVILYAQWLTLSGTAITTFTSSAATVVIPSGVTSIGVEAFSSDPNLTSITIPATINGTGFSMTEAFIFCPNLTTITLASGSPYAIVNGALVDPRSGGTLIEVPAMLSGNFTMPVVANIDDYAFSDCSQLTGITISNAVATALGGTIYADYFSGMHSHISITIPSNISTLAAWAFEQSYFTSVTIQGSNVTIQMNAFSGNSYLATITFDSSTPPTTINNGAFTGASASLQIQVPSAALAAYQADAAAWGILSTQIVGY